jgi:hypothetical protein
MYSQKKPLNHQLYTRSINQLYGRALIEKKNVSDCWSNIFQLIIQNIAPRSKHQFVSWICIDVCVCVCVVAETSGYCLIDESHLPENQNISPSLSLIFSFYPSFSLFVHGAPITTMTFTYSFSICKDNNISIQRFFFFFFPLDGRNKK